MTTAAHERCSHPVYRRVKGHPTAITEHACQRPATTWGQTRSGFRVYHCAAHAPTGAEVGNYVLTGAVPA